MEDAILYYGNSGKKGQEALALNRAGQVIAEVKKAVVGKDRVLIWVMTVILARGHILLEDIPGVGPARRRALLAHFGSIKKMREADQDELCTVKGMNKTAAAAVYAALHPVIPEDTETEE